MNNFGVNNNPTHTHLILQVAGSIVHNNGITGVQEFNDIIEFWLLLSCRAAALRPRYATSAPHTS